MIPVMLTLPILFTVIKISRFKMGNISSNINNVTQKFMNNITQQNKTSCISTATATQDNNNVILVGGNFTGDVVGVQGAAVSTDASCLITSNMDNSISNILEATTQQTNSANNDWFGGFSISVNTNVNNLLQTVNNNIAQINQTACTSSAIYSASNNYIYVENASGTNFYGVKGGEAVSSANCVMTNIMKNTTYNQAQASNDQGNVIIGMFAGLIAVVGGIIGLVVIGMIILFGLGAVGYVGYSVVNARNKPATTHIPGLSDSDAQLIQTLGINPTDLALGTLPPETTSTDTASSAGIPETPPS